jgi:hexokinase
MKIILAALGDMFRVSEKQINEIAKAFEDEMILCSMSPQEGSLKMLRSCYSRPSGREEGDIIALDFGGTNIRILLVNLKEGTCQIREQKVFALAQLPNTISTGEELFGFLATEIGKMINQDQKYLLGHCFSFPSRQISRKSALLLHWSKEIDLASLQGQDVNALLAQALISKGLTNIEITALVNDTVATLLAGAYLNPNADIGSICGTGYNSCYVETQAGCSKGEIINIEAGGFNHKTLRENVFDIEVDIQSEIPGVYRLEKMVAGRYLGEILRLIFIYLAKNQLVFTIRDFPEILNTPYTVSTGDLALLLAEETNAETDHLLKDKWGLVSFTANDLETISYMARCIVNRSADLIAGIFAGIIRYMDPDLQSPHSIVIDGSLYEKLPGYSMRIEKNVNEALGNEHTPVKLNFVKDGSGLGAAIAAAMSEDIIFEASCEDNSQYLHKIIISL